jgi:catechol 2,3-dioxygenase-like lactoylglutathione lyase family enzyme
MKRFHVHLNVTDLAASVRFYSVLFGSEPTVRKDDYAKWMLEDPRVNFALSALGRSAGVDHLGIQAESADELADLGARLDAAGGTVLPETATVCCYARSDKAWTEDPQGTRWETFHTFGEATTYHAGDAACATDGAACTPQAAAMKPKIDTGAPCCAPQSGCC